MAMAMACAHAMVVGVSAFQQRSHAAPSSSSSSSTFGRAIEISSRRATVKSISLRVRAAAQKQKRENVETPNISTPPLPVGSSPLEGESGEEAASSSGQDEMDGEAAVKVEGASEEKQLTAEEIGQQLKALRISRGEVSTSPQDFWGGVWEETKLVEWPQFKKVLGTTGVVVGIIFGSSILLLTLNAVLAELSDQVFNGSSEFAKSWTRGGF